MHTLSNINIIIIIIIQEVYTTRTVYIDIMHTTSVLESTSLTRVHTDS